MIVLFLFFFWCLALLHGAVGYFVSGWIGRRMKPEASPFVPYVLTFFVLMSFLRVEGFGLLPNTLATVLISGVGLGLAALDRRRRGVSVFEDEALSQPPPPRASS